MRRPLVIALLSLATATPRIAAAAPGEGAPPADPPVGLALASGAATVLLPLALGVAHAANVSTFRERNIGFMVAGAGFALSPIVAHVVVGEYARAAVFAAAPVAAEIGIITLTTVEPSAIFGATKGTRTAFGFMFSLGAFSAALGLVDVALARDRARERLPKALRNVTLTPSIGPGTAGVFLGGTL